MNKLEKQLESLHGSALVSLEETKKVEDVCPFDPCRFRSYFEWIKKFGDQETTESDWAVVVGFPAFVATPVIVPGLIVWKKIVRSLGFADELTSAEDTLMIHREALNGLNLSARLLGTLTIFLLSGIICVPACGILTIADLTPNLGIMFADYVKIVGLRSQINEYVLLRRFLSQKMKTMSGKSSVDEKTLTIPDVNDFFIWKRNNFV